MRRAIAISTRRFAALAVATASATGTTATTSSAAALQPCLRFQSSSVPGGVPPEMRAPAGSNPARNPPRPGGSAETEAPEEEPSFAPPEKPTEAPKFIKVSSDEKGVAHVQLARKPVNSLNLEFLQELNQWLLWMGSNEETRAIVLSSAFPTVFSAGLDLTELHNPNPERIAQFWQQLQETWLIMNSFPKPIIAAVTGNSPAGGCILAMACDYRVMARGAKGNTDEKRLYRIGLNETKLGLTAPAWTMPAYAYLLGPRLAERYLQLGETPVADEALRVGLIDEVAEDDEKAVEAAFRQVDRFLSVPNNSRWMSRDMMRREYLQMMASEEDRAYDTEFTTQLIMNPETQKNLGNYLARLKGHVRK